MLFIEQRGNDLSERLKSVIKYAEKQNFSPIITIGADSPTLPAEFIQTAIESFKTKKTDITLGETKDGGFYLIGLQKFAPGIFKNIVWSSASVFRQTAANAEKVGLRNLLKLPIWYDIDTPDDLVFLRNEMINDKKMQRRAPKTFQWLISHSRLFD